MESKNNDDDDQRSKHSEEILFRYAAVFVDHSDESPCSGRFLLHQGIQRRIGITICHESGANLRWNNVHEVLIGLFFSI